jgi:hypothetical protein
LENTPRIIEGLLENCGDDITGGASEQTPDEILSRSEYIKQCNAWMDRFLTTLEEL